MEVSVSEMKTFVTRNTATLNEILDMLSRFKTARWYWRGVEERTGQADPAFCCRGHGSARGTGSVNAEQYRGPHDPDSARGKTLQSKASVAVGSARTLNFLIIQVVRSSLSG